MSHKIANAPIILPVVICRTVLGFKGLLRCVDVDLRWEFGMETGEESVSRVYGCTKADCRWSSRGAERRVAAARVEVRPRWRKGVRSMQDVIVEVVWSLGRNYVGVVELKLSKLVSAEVDPDVILLGAFWKPRGSHKAEMIDAG